ncbi:hypothetical protein CBR_g40299 [Chara braunii]|uniref:Uncharacterized protein n=1 Tax=Chara braunii TaxID=69332 RepID=A0A388K1W8_CHABU|nr:hypothetical protein CBR_g40299 [Chara braunii]|eukprot:GBG64052.1 hypothetical protein CBR_g40299 [Chara braunii]
MEHCVIHTKDHPSPDDKGNEITVPGDSKQMKEIKKLIKKVLEEKWKLEDLHVVAALLDPHQKDRLELFDVPFVQVRKGKSRLKEIMQQVGEGGGFKSELSEIAEVEPRSERPRKRRRPLPRVITTCSSDEEDAVLDNSVDVVDTLNERIEKELEVYFNLKLTKDEKRAFSILPWWTAKGTAVKTAEKQLLLLPLPIMAREARSLSRSRGESLSGEEWNCQPVVHLSPWWTRVAVRAPPHIRKSRKRVPPPLKERKEEAKKQALLEAQAAKKKKLEEEMERLKREEEEKLKEVEEEEGEEEEEEEIPLVRIVRREERGESSGVSEDEKKLEKMVSEWVANFSLGEDEEALMYIPQDERDADVAEIKALTDPLQQQALEEEKRMEWKLQLRRQRRRCIAAATELQKELAATAERHTNALAQGLAEQGGCDRKKHRCIDSCPTGADAYLKGPCIALQSIRVGFRDFAHDMMMRMGSGMQARTKNTKQFCVGAIEGAKLAVPKEEEARPHRERVKVKFSDAYNGTQGEDFDNWEANINSYVHLPEEQVLVAFHALRDEASSFARSLARAAKCDNDMVAHSTITPLNEFLKLLREHFADVTKGIKASEELQTIHTRQWKSARTLKGAMDELVAVPNQGVTEP